ncbi:hypothetical protein K440DRAFT_635984 [Wilcoxina mikolae CBS 423.85]|nr:hypothetical protein K440DRAFT_635984 [Wilcoxina mikolae CBS 423.85]
MIVSGQSPDSSSEYEWSSTESQSEETESTELKECLIDVSYAITCLYKFSIDIRNPAPRDRLEKCSEVDVSFYERSDIEHVQHKFLDANEYLRERLEKANTKRRQLLKYHEKNHEKILCDTLRDTLGCSIFSYGNFGVDRLRI